MLKEFTVDWDNASEIKSLISNLQKRRKNLLKDPEKGNYVHINFGVSNQNLNDLMEIFDFFYNLSPVNQLVESGEYYVYVHCDPTKKLNITRDVREYLLATKFNLTHMPIYVGKGIGNRSEQLNRNEGHRKIRTGVLKQKKDLIVIKVNTGLSESVALFEEMRLVTFLGIKVLNGSGYLTNLHSDHSVVDFYNDNIKQFNPKIERLKVKARNLIKHMRKWV